MCDTDRSGVWKCGWNIGKFWSQNLRGNITRGRGRDNYKNCTVRMKWIAHFAVDILLLHHYKSDLAHLSYLDSLVIRISKYERWAKNNWNMKN